MSANNGGPAFPNAVYNMKGGYDIVGGMTLRDYFAAKAMVVVPDQSAYNMRDNEAWYSYTARMAYLMADAMLKARES